MIALKYLELSFQFTVASSTEYRLYIVDTNNKRLNKGRKVSQKLEKLKAGIFTQKTINVVQEVFSEILRTNKGYEIATKKLIQKEICHD
jgi:hypothetical protein